MNALIYLLQTALEVTPRSARPVTYDLVALVTYVKYLNFNLTTNIWKKNIEREKEREREREREKERKTYRLTVWIFLSHWSKISNT